MGPFAKGTVDNGRSLRRECDTAGVLGGVFSRSRCRAFSAPLVEPLGRLPAERERLHSARTPPQTSRFRPVKPSVVIRALDLPSQDFLPHQWCPHSRAVT